MEENNIENVSSGNTEENIDTKKGPKQPLWCEILDFVIIVAVAFLIALFLTSFVVLNCKIPSGSMESTIMTGDRVMGNRLAYTFGKPKRGDIAIFKAPQLALNMGGHLGKKYGDVLYIKRVVGLPGDTIEVKNSLIYINGSEVPLEEPYLEEENLVPCSLYNFGPYTLGEKEYFMMGDNRDNSLDSRAWGPVPEDDILAKALFTYWPLNDISWLSKSYEYVIPEK